MRRKNEQFAQWGGDVVQKEDIPPDT